MSYSQLVEKSKTMTDDELKQFIALLESAVVIRLSPGKAMWKKELACWKKELEA